MGQTMAFMTLAFSQLFHAFNLKSPHASLLRTGIGNNKMLIGAFFLSGMLQLGVIAIAPLRSLFEIALLDRSLLMHLGLLIVAPVFIVEAQKAVTRFAQRKGGTS